MAAGNARPDHSNAKTAPAAAGLKVLEGVPGSATVQQALEGHQGKGRDMILSVVSGKGGTGKITDASPIRRLRVRYGFGPSAARKAW